jgi:hypothetical protein
MPMALIIFSNRSLMLPWKEFCILLAILILFNVLLGCATLGILYLIEK